jgi:hypothetical protein
MTVMVPLSLCQGFLERTDQLICQIDDSVVAFQGGFDFVVLFHARIFDAVGNVLTEGSLLGFFDKGAHSRKTGATESLFNTTGDDDTGNQQGANACVGEARTATQAAIATLENFMMLFWVVRIYSTTITGIQQVVCMYRYCKEPSEEVNREQKCPPPISLVDFSFECSVD